MSTGATPWRDLDRPGRVDFSGRTRARSEQWGGSYFSVHRAEALVGMNPLPAATSVQLHLMRKSLVSAVAHAVRRTVRWSSASRYIDGRVARLSHKTCLRRPHPSRAPDECGNKNIKCARTPSKRANNLRARCQNSAGPAPPFSCFGRSLAAISTKSAKLKER